MEQFEKWWKKISMEGMWDYEEYAKLGWDAALEWALSKGFMDDFCDEFISAKDIEKELGDEQKS